MFTDIFIDLLQDNNISAYKLSAETGISESLIGKYKKGTVVPTRANLIKIADYFGVSVDYLLGKTSDSAPASNELIFGDFEYAFYDASRELDEKDKEELLRSAKRMRELKRSKSK